MSDLATFLDLERRVWQALVDGDAAADRALLAEDFLGVYSPAFPTAPGMWASWQRGRACRALHSATRA